MRGPGVSPPINPQSSGALPSTPLLLAISQGLFSQEVISVCILYLEAV